VKLLVLGGTKFLGRAAVEGALAEGHDVTFFTRGRTNPDLFPDAEHVVGDLTQDVSPLAGGTWDAAVDLDPTQLPRHTRRRAETLRDAVGHYVFVSTISVYADPTRPIDEGSTLLQPPDPEPVTFAVEDYGGLKVGSERVVLDVFGSRCAVVRPGLIAGPNDPTGRFTYWPVRLAEGGDVLAPGDPEAPLQLIDARDLGAWLVRVAAEQTSGVFNATGPERPLTLRETLQRVAAAVGGDVNLVWTEEQRILDAGVQPWMELPLWIPGDEARELMRADISRALDAGLRFRPLEETARDTLAWSLAAGGEAATLSREREREILADA
jgi:nucleoside-diphosphate-sugar epimerase